MRQHCSEALRAQKHRAVLSFFGLFAAGIALLVPLSASAQVSWPSDSQWLPATRGGVPIMDPNNDSTGHNSNEFVGAPQPPSIPFGAPTYYSFRDGTNLYARMRIDGDPTGRTPNAWGCVLDVDSTPTTFEYLWRIESGLPSANVVVERNTVTTMADNVCDLVDSPQPSPYPLSHPSSTYSRIVLAPTTFNATSDYFLDLAVPLADIPLLTTTQPVRFVCGSGQGNTEICRDPTSSTISGGSDSCSGVPLVCGCSTNTDCSGSTPICELSSHTCRACSAASATDCTGATPACGTMGMCVQCTSSMALACMGATPVCNSASNACVLCTLGAMGDRRACAMSIDGAACVAGASSADPAFCGCALDSDCGGAMSGRICDASTHRCRAGCWPGAMHNGCPTGLFCTSNEPTTVGVCSSTCTRDGDCAGSATQPYCALRTPMSACVQCLTDMHCSARSDRRRLCIGANDTCAECSATTRGTCLSTDNGSACLSTGLCGCTTDSDCVSNRRCELTTNTCVMRATADAGVDAGDRLDGGAPDASLSLTGDGACGCRVHGAHWPRRSSLPLVALAALAALGSVRRRPRS